MRAKKKILKYEDLWSKIRDLIRSLTTNSDGYDEKYSKIKFNSDDELPLKNDRNSQHDNLPVARAVFHENNKYYLEVFLDECLYKLQTQKKQKVSIFYLHFY